LSPLTPSTESGLEASPDLDIKEHEYASYNCKNGHFLKNEKTKDIWQNKFHVKCTSADVFNGGVMPTWPLCLASTCATLPEPEGYTLVSNGPIYGGGKAMYKCATAGHVTDQGAVFGYPCLPTGEIDEPDTWPTCAAANDCTNPPPSPPASSRLSPAVDGGDAKEYDYASYPCMEDFEFPNGDTYFKLACDDNGAFPVNPTWPECVAPSCSYDIPAGLRTDNGLSSGSDLLQQGQSRTLQCQLGSQVVNATGYEVDVTCSPGGINPDPSGLLCVLPEECTMTVPNPPLDTMLTRVGSASSLNKEYDTMTFACPDGYTLEGVVDAKMLNAEKNLVVTCDNDVSIYPFPSCKPLCMEYPVPPASYGLVVKDSSVKVAPNGYGLYRCAEDDEVPDVTNHSPDFGVMCDNDGKFTVPSWPTCRKIVSCPFPPVPPSDAVFRMVDGDIDVTELEMAYYECPTGFERKPPYPPNFDAKTKKLSLK